MKQQGVWWQGLVYETLIIIIKLKNGILKFYNLFLCLGNCPGFWKWNLQDFPKGKLVKEVENVKLQ